MEPGDRSARGSESSDSRLSFVVLVDPTAALPVLIAPMGIRGGPASVSSGSIAGMLIDVDMLSGRSRLSEPDVEVGA